MLCYPERGTRLFWLYFERATTNSYTWVSGKLACLYERGRDGRQTKTNAYNVMFLVSVLHRFMCWATHCILCLTRSSMVKRLTLYQKSPRKNRTPKMRRRIKKRKKHVAVLPF